MLQKMTEIKGGGKLYELIVPIGNNCSAARQLERLELRRYSYPFDWLAAGDDEALSQACTLLETHFKDFLVWENLRRCPESEKGGHPAYYDDGSRRMFLHDFYKGALHDGYAEVVKKYHRRIERLYKLLEKSQSILFVYVSAKPEQASVVQLTAAYERLCQIAGRGKCVDLFVMKYASDKTMEGYIDAARHIYVSEDVRPYDETFFHFYSPLAKFLLSVRLVTDVPAPAKKLSLLEKLYYRLNKHTAKWLKKRGIKLANPVVYC